MVGLPEAATFSISSFCSPTRSMSDRSVSSPDVLSVQRPRYMYSPATTMFRSQVRASDAARFTLASDMLRGSQPWSANTKSVSGETIFRPSRTVITFSGFWSALQSPRILWSSALMPVTRTLRYFSGLSGRSPSFFSRTMDFRAASRAVCLCASHSLTSIVVFSSAYGCSKRPSLNLISRILRTDSSIRLSGILPSLTSSHTYSFQ